MDALYGEHLLSHVYKSFFTETPSRFRRLECFVELPYVLAETLHRPVLFLDKAHELCRGVEAVIDLPHALVDAGIHPTELLADEIEGLLQAFLNVLRVFPEPVVQLVFRLRELSSEVFQHFPQNG